ncbi:sigma factor-like helix-turn-helix DNA-binding protein [Sphingomonas sp. AR_OL41]|uniref:sigma factor-like helix-turn-helix DNA-binding protein n=1 Tax=Sphingomonas sp. AR_OL41 TaxID=3042729 RepID=UPI00247FBA47|nr:sigma factor-like helix-turn-helix DNA-binding protein [Sphingomonas sp. AR_OL41]MDH7973662.1 sigma factor-like helix-turn-helix DNA-binding protein [Sphingomonas sp. AR_OL41]
MAGSARASFELARLERAVASMEEGARAVFLMHLLDGFAYEEIGRRLGLSVGEVERRFAAAMYHMSCELDVGGEAVDEQRE